VREMIIDEVSFFRYREVYPFFLYPEEGFSGKFSAPLSKSKLAIWDLDLTDLIEKISYPSRSSNNFVDKICS
jgi:hypothetical protein